MALFELSLMCPEDRVEHLSEALDALDALSVSVEDADAQTDAEQALFGAVSYTHLTLPTKA